MLNALLGTLRRYDMVKPGDTVVCAVSGGADSMALLWALYLLKEKLGITLCAAHFNHGLRGEESNGDEAHVRRFCQQFDIPLTVGAGQVIAGKKGLEAAARDARYRFLEGLSGKIATAHTADDNAETVLMHLVRGTGLKGLGGIAPVRGSIIRPMLDVTRQQVLDFLAEYHIDFVNDSSNESDAFLRNRLRHGVMPLLKAENPSLVQNLSAMSQHLRQDEEALRVQADFSEGLSVEQLLSQPPAVQNRLAAGFLKFCGVKEPEMNHIALLMGLAASEKPSASAEFPGGVTVRRRYAVLVRGEAESQPQAVMLPLSGQVRFADTTVLTMPAEEGAGVCPQGQMIVRSRQSGDAIRLHGGTKSVKKLMIDHKIPADLRSRIAVVADEQGILAVEGFGYDLDRLTENGNTIHIKFQKDR